MKWEYIIFWLGFNPTKELNEMGQLGWELVAVILDDESYKVFMKRPNQEYVSEIIKKQMGIPPLIVGVKDES